MSKAGGALVHIGGTCPVLRKRLCLVPLFYYTGIGKVMNFAQTAGRLPGGAEGFGMLLAAGAIAVELGVATALLLGLYTRQAAVALILLVIAATLIFHNFWAVPEAQVLMHTIQFLKNLGLIGELVLIATFGSGPHALRPDGAVSGRH